MRTVLFALTLLAAPAHAWEFSPDPVCTLSHATPDADVAVTYDPASQEYAITLTRAETPWPTGIIFEIRFSGPRTLTISTTRHELSEDGRALTVRDRGFGNVLNGIEFNTTATAIINGPVISVPLTGAAPEVQKFRACAEALTA
ncbi:MAG: excinuclease ABC subunit B [Pseudomonadota bacterium]